MKELSEADVRYLQNLIDGLQIVYYHHLHS